MQGPSPFSQPELSEAGAFSAEALDHEPRDLVAGERYELLAELGQGGMGRVVLARDRLLGREVAIKMPASAEMEVRLAHEARLTAGLQHPGIVTVYDYGKSPEGRSWYVMPVVRGSSLADRLSVARTAEARLACLRPLLAACQAVAYAHSRGVVHRDLTAANIMIGEFGEVQVLDWGLAVTIAEAQATAPGRAGTPGAMSPEQRRGAPLDARSDVWTLGALLRTVVTGAPAKATVPRALLAVVARACADDPADRYADAAELARELERYLDGRRVDAHNYSGLELLGRLLRAWRTPLIVTAVALVALAVVLILAFERIGSERTVSEDRLARVLVAKARDAMGTQRGAEAEVLAAHAQARTPLAEARGILASGVGDALPAPELLQTPPCRPVDVSPDGAVICLEQGRLTYASSGAARWTLPDHIDRAVFLAHGALIAVFAGRQVQRYRASDGGAVGEAAEVPSRDGVIAGPDGDAVLVWHGSQVVELDAETQVRLPMACAPAMVEAVALAPGRSSWVFACGDGSIVVGGPAGFRRLDVGLGSAPDRPLTRALAFVAPRVILAGDDAGTLVELRLDDLQARRTVALGGTPFLRALLPVEGGDWVVATLDDGPPVLFDVRSFAPVGYLPDHDIRAVRPAPGGRFVSAGVPVAAWNPALARPWRLELEPGVGAIAMAPDGKQVAVQHGASISLVDTSSRRVVTSFRWQDGIIKALDIAPDGEIVAFGFGDSRVMSLASGRDPRSLGALGPGKKVRHLVALGGGEALGALYGPHVLFFSHAAEPRTILEGDVVRLAGTPDRRTIVALLASGSLRCGHRGESGSGGGEWEFARCGDAGDATSIAVDADASHVFAGGARGVEVMVTAPGGEGAAGEGRFHRHYDSAGAELVDVDSWGDWLVASAKDGSVILWRFDDAAPWASLHAHDRRTAGVVMSPSGDLAVSGGWDGRVVFLATTTHPLTPAETEAKWALSLDDTVRAEWRRAQ